MESILLVSFLIILLFSLFKKLYMGLIKEDSSHVYEKTVYKVKPLNLPGIKLANDTFQKLSLSEKRVASKYIDSLIFIIKNNVKYLPQNVLNMEYSQKVISAFIWYYAVVHFFDKFSQEHSFMLLTIVLEKLDKAEIFKIEDFDLNIYKDSRWSRTMPVFIEAANKIPLVENIIILIYIEQYMESITGTKIKYIRTPTNNIEQQINCSSKRTVKKDENLDTMDKIEHLSEHWEARNVLGKFLQEKFNKHHGFRWIRVDPMSPKFDDMSFAYKNKIFSVLIDLKNNKKIELTEKEKNKFLTECIANNLIPCIFPISEIENLSLLPEESWNLYDIRTNELINPLTVATDEKILMSNYELNNMAVEIVKEYIKKEKMVIKSYCDLVGIQPQICFRDAAGELSWIYVNYSTNTLFKDETDDLNKLITRLPQFNGYIARVGLICTNQEKPYRGSGFYVKFDGIEKIHSANATLQHGDGIEINYY